MNDQSDFQHLLRVARRRWAWLLFIPILCSGLAYFAATRQSDVYQASADIRIVGSDIVTDVALITSQEVNSEARSRLEDSLDDIISVDASTIGDTELARITVRATTPQAAALAANEWASSFADIRNEGQTADLRAELDGLLQASDLLLPQIIDVEDQIAVLEAVETPTDAQRADLADLRSRQSLLDAQQRDLVDRATAIQTQLITAPVIVTTTNEANEPRRPTEPKPVQQALFGLIGGLFLGVLAAALAEMFDDRIWEPRQLSSATGGLPVLASVPSIGRSGRHSLSPITAAVPQHPASEAFTLLGRTLRHDESLRSYPVIMLTTASPSEGRSVVASNLAFVFARLGERVLLVEMDFRSKGQGPNYDIDRSRGLTDMLENDVDFDDLAVPINGAGPGSLFVLPSGPEPVDPTELAASSAMAKALVDMRNRFDRVVIEAGPVLLGTTAVSIAQQVDGLCLAVRYQATHARDVERALSRLDQVGVTQMGVVISDAPDDSLFVRSHSRSMLDDRVEAEVPYQRDNLAR